MLFPELSPGHRESILRHNWWGHDGRWYMFVANELGFHKANEMNMAINKAVGKLEINTSDYECACFKRAEGWFEALGVNGTSFVRKSLVRGDEFCEVVIRSANVGGFSAEVVQ